MWAPIYQTTWRHILLKHWYLSTELCCVMFIWNFGNHVPNHMTSHPRKLKLPVYNCHNFRSRWTCIVFISLIVIVVTGQHLLFLACTRMHVCICFSAGMHPCHTQYLIKSDFQASAFYLFDILFICLQSFNNSSTPIPENPKFQSWAASSIPFLNSENSAAHQFKNNEV
jgi:hypothetical protein